MRTPVVSQCDVGLRGAVCTANQRSSTGVGSRRNYVHDRLSPALELRRASSSVSGGRRTPLACHSATDSVAAFAAQGIFTTALHIS